MSNYPDNMDWKAYEAAYGSFDYDRQTPDQIRNTLASLHGEIADFIIKLGVREFGSDKVFDRNLLIAMLHDDGLYDAAYDYISAAEDRERGPDPDAAYERARDEMSGVL